VNAPVERAYVNKAQANGGKHDVALNLSFELEGEDPVLVSAVVMPREFVPALIELLKKEIGR
jgi:hypothetical protein